MLNEILKKLLGEARWYDVDCSRDLGAGETILTVVSAAAGDSNLVIGIPVVNDAPLVYENGYRIEIGKAIRAQISGGAIIAGQRLPDGSNREGTRYTIIWAYTTSSGNTQEAVTTLDVTRT